MDGDRSMQRALTYFGRNPPIRASFVRRSRFRQPIELAPTDNQVVYSRKMAMIPRGWYPANRPMENPTSGPNGNEPASPRWSLVPLRSGWHGWPHFRRALFEAARPLPALAAICFWLHEYDTAPEAARREPDPARSLTLALAAQGLTSDPSDVRLLPDATPSLAATRHERSIVRARRGSEPSDIYLVRSRRA